MCQALAMLKELKTRERKASPAPPTKRRLLGIIFFQEVAKSEFPDRQRNISNVEQKPYLRISCKVAELQVRRLLPRIDAAHGRLCADIGSVLVASSLCVPATRQIKSARAPATALPYVRVDYTLMWMFPGSPTIEEQCRCLKVVCIDGCSEAEGRNSW